MVAPETEKEEKTMTEHEKRELVRGRLKKEGIEFILAQFVDIHGGPKVKQVPVECFGPGIDPRPTNLPHAAG